MTMNLFKTKMCSIPSFLAHCAEYKDCAGYKDAQVIASEGEQRAAAALKEAATVMQQSPQAMQVNPGGQV